MGQHKKNGTPKCIHSRSHKKNTVVFIFLLVPSSLVHIRAANTNTHSTNSPIIISLDTDLFPRSLFFIFIFLRVAEKNIYNITERKSMGKMCIFCCYSANESFFFRTTFSEVGYATWIGLNGRELHTALTEKNVNEFESFSFMQKCTFFRCEDWTAMETRAGGDVKQLNDATTITSNTN